MQLTPTARISRSTSEMKALPTCHDTSAKGLGNGRVSGDQIRWTDSSMITASASVASSGAIRGPFSSGRRKNRSSATPSAVVRATANTAATGSGKPPPTPKV